jgi:hypothetical protein
MTRISDAIAALSKYDFGRSTDALFLVEKCLREPKLAGELAQALHRVATDPAFSFAARQFACKTLWILGPSHATAAFEMLLASPDVHLVEAACYAIGCAPSPEADALLEKARDRARGDALLAISSLIASRQIAETTAVDGYAPLFNGRNLDEWEIDTPGIWQLRKGVIIGRSPGLKYNDFLRTKKSYENFVLRAKIRMIDGDGNSGIQFRSKPAAVPHEVSGYQADAGEAYWGALYDESRRNKTLAGPDDAFRDRFDPTIWHSYVISAKGSHIRLELDGVETVNYEEHEAGIPRGGFIALQVHAWPHPVEVWFRDLMIQVL